MNTKIGMNQNKNAYFRPFNCFFMLFIDDYTFFSKMSYESWEAKTIHENYAAK
jgi:hypothetical protein